MNNNLFWNIIELSKLDSDIKMNSNPCYDIPKWMIKKKLCMHGCELFKFLVVNPSYEVIEEYNRLHNNSDNVVYTITV